MDPNATLKELRSALPLCHSSERHTAIGALMRVAELTEALDQWLSNGGFLPTDWEHK